MTPAKTLGAGEFCGASVRRRQVHGFLITENRFAAGQRIDRHAHAHAHFTLVLKGGFTETYGAKVLECAPASVLIVPPHEPHLDQVWEAGAHSLGVELSPGALRRAEEAIGPFSEARVLGGEGARRYARRLYEEFRAGDAASGLAMESLALETLVWCARGEGARETGGEPGWMTRVREALRERFADPPTMADLAVVAGVHESHLARAFRQRHGCTVGGYTRRLRLEAASRALVQTSRPLGEIALEAGFCDQAHFCRAFRQAHGLSPTAYRKSARSD